MKTPIIIFLLIFLTFCRDSNSDVKESLSKQSTNSTPKELTDLLDTISSQLRIQRLSKSTPHIDNVIRSEHRVTYIPGGCDGTNTMQGVCFNLVMTNYIKDTIITHFKAYHFGFTKNRTFFEIDTIFKVIDIDVPFSIYSDFDNIEYGAYLDDQIEYSPSGNAAPDRFFIERHTNDYEFGKPIVNYKLIVKHSARPGNLKSMLDFGFKLARFEWKENYR